MPDFPDSSSPCEQFRHPAIPRLLLPNRIQSAAYWNYQFFIPLRPLVFRRELAFKDRQLFSFWISVIQALQY